MAQDVKTTNDAIVNALYLIGELGVGETPDNFMLVTGLDLLNEMLNKWAADSVFVPYLTTITFNFVANQQTYSLSNIVPADIDTNRIIDLSFANFFMPTNTDTQLVYPIKIISKAQYTGVVRQTQLNSRPGFVFLNKQAEASFITFYPAPDQPYQCEIQVKSMLNNLTQQDTLGELPPNYYGLIKRGLARQFLSYYPAGNWTPLAEQEYQEYYQTMKVTNETDLTIRPSVILTAPEPFYWANILSY